WTPESHPRIYTPSTQFPGDAQFTKTRSETDTTIFEMDAVEPIPLEAAYLRPRTENQPASTNRRSFRYAVREPAFQELFERNRRRRISDVEPALVETRRREGLWIDSEHGTLLQ